MVSKLNQNQKLRRELEHPEYPDIGNVKMNHGKKKVIEDNQANPLTLTQI